MKVLIITNLKVENIDATFVNNSEKAVEELYAQNFDIVIFGNDIAETEETKLRKILSLQHYEILVLRQQSEQLSFTLAQAKFMLNNYRHQQKGTFTVTDIDNKSVSNEKNTE